ncbi:MAG: tRNA (adenosine(37)-N6)-threonylcarbamoyltransferase complex ATPase subunit type 1 TsaE [Longimicrobiales bacterium]|nr:tRNA (adenosine(37)-N6)-threonylcarbamoyltransferase complex ATPase subunit type 1 TsaE [Longimicrobiales bacterium]
MHLVEEDLVRWGRTIGRLLGGPSFLALRGPLGAGKSVLARAIARGAGIEAAIPSPTFNLIFRYPMPDGGELVHLDLYRLGDPDEVWELGWEELGRDEEIVIVEWPERAERFLPGDRWDLRLEMVPGEPLLRRISVDRVGDPPELPSFPLTLSGSRSRDTVTLFPDADE